MTSGQAKSNGLVKRFVDHIQGSDQVQELISADGRLHKPTFALLVTQYLGETNQTPLRADSAVRRGSGRVAERYLDRGSAGDKERLSNEDAKTSETAEIVNRFIARMQDAAEIESVVNAQGKLDLEVFENMVSRYLAEASGATEEAVLDAQDLQTLCAHEFREVSKNLQDTGRQGTPVTTETVMPESRRVSAAFTKRFIAQMEQAAEVEPMATADGKLNKATFEKLTTRYLVQSSTGNDNNFLSQARSPLALAQARRNAGRGGRRMAIVKQESVIEDFGGPQSPGFIRHFVQQMEDAAEREPFVTAEGRLDEPAFERLVKKSLAEAATASYALDNGQSRAISEVNADYTAFPPLGSHASTGFVEQFVAHMEEVSRDEEFVAVDKPLLEELVLRCLVAFEKDDVLDNTKGDSSGGGVPNIDSARSPLQDNSEKQCGSFDADVSRLVSSGFVEGLVDHLDEVSKKEPLIDSDGSLNIQTFKKEMARFLDEIASPSTKAASVGSRSLGLSQGASKGQPSSSSRHQHFGGDAASLPGVQESPTGSAFFRDMRQTGATTTLTRSQQSDTFSSRRDDVKGSADYSDQVEGLEEDESVVDSNVCTSEAIQRNGIGDETSKNLGMAHRFAGSVSKVGGFVQMMYGKARSTKEEELQAVAAFRRTQGDRDDTSSLSSFRISDGMKQVVESFRASKLSTKNESDEYGFAEKDFDQESVGDLARRSSYESQEASASLYSQGSFSASESEAASGADFSPERAKFFRQIVMDKSALIGEGTAERSIIDTDGSDASRTVIDAEMIKNLLLSPTILTKRHQQAIRAVEQRSWEQISYLLSANPWLAEMNDLSTGQYLLHKLALYGAGEASIDKSTGEVVAVRRPAAPDQINTDLIRMFPASVHKFDQDGNLPLHMAAASANSAMIKLLGDRFPSGASVRNEDGMLPLHLTILACASPSIASLGEEGSPIGVIKTVLQYFPSAVAVVDNEGNLPIHTAAAALSGHIGVDVVYLLLDEANRQMKNPSGVRFRNKVKIEDIEDTSIATETTVSPTDSANGFNDITHCNMVRNDFGETPLLVAIHARAGWELIEAIACGEDGRRAALWQESGMQNALHLLVSDRFKDPAAALSILKVAPAAAAVRNEEGMLPIEVGLDNSVFSLTPKARISFSPLFNIVLSDCLHADASTGGHLSACTR
jgi:ankyrin repeat protein